MPVKTTRPPQDIEQLRKRYSQLDRKKIEAETSLKAANEQLKKLKKQAREAYGTDDPEALSAKLAAMQTDNERKRAEYQKHLDEVEANLAAVEEQHQDVEED
jgi:phage shock protein A